MDWCKRSSTIDEWMDGWIGVCNGVCWSGFLNHGTIRGIRVGWVGPDCIPFDVFLFFLNQA